jgi:16S rRNA C1402 N4-methylase RsmH
MLDALSRWVATSSAKSAVLASFDQDGIELAKTEARLRARPSFSSESAALSLDCIHANFATVGDAFAQRQLPKAHALLADLGCSSMQIDDPARGFTWKTEGPLDMRMDITSSVTAAELLVRSNVTSLASLLHAHSDFDMADARALALAILDAPVPATTSALASKVRSVKPSVPVEEASPVEASGRPYDVRGPGGGKGGGGKGGGGKDGGGKGGGGKGGVVGGRGGSLKGEMPRERDGGLRAVEHAKRLRALGTKRLLLELDEDDEAEARAAARASAGKLKPLSAEVSVEEAEKELNSRVARVMQALRVEVNAEFAALDSLLASLPSVLAPSGRAVFLTFHSGEDRRVKQAMKEGLKAGVYSEVSRRVVRVGSEEARANPRSKCCKLRWCVRAAD